MSIRELTPPDAVVEERPPGRRSSAWPAVRTVAAQELRRRWRQLVALGLLAGLTGAVLLAVAQLERRTSTVYQRLQETTGLDDARIPIPAGPAGAALAQLPEVRSSWPGSVTVSQLEGPGVVYVSIVSGPPRPPDLLAPLLVEGRLPADDRADEVLIGEPLARETGLRPGSELRLAMLTPEEIDAFDTGFGTPDGPRLSVRVAGIGRFPGWGTGLGFVVGTPAFAERYARFSPGGLLLVRLADEPGVQQRLDRGVADLVAARGITTSEAVGPVRPVYSRPGDPAVLATQRLLSTSLLVFLAVAGAGSLLTVVQAASRHASTTLDDQQVEAALGLTRGERRLARVLPAMPVALLAGTVAVAGGLASAGWTPLASLGPLEPRPGWTPNVAVLVGGGLAVAGALLLAVTLTAAPALHRAGTPVTTVARRLPLLWSRPAGVAGGTFALAGRTGRGGVPLRSAVIGVAVGIAGLISSLVFAAGAARLESSPATYGWSADVELVDAKEPDVARLVADPRVRDLDLVEQSSVRVGARDVPLLGRTVRKGDLPWSVVRGRLPTAPDEVAVGPHLARELDVTVGDVVRATDPSGRERALDVVGIAFTAPQGTDSLGTAMVATAATVTTLRGEPGYVSALVRAVPGAAPAVVDELGAAAEIALPSLPPELADLRDLGGLPVLLGLFYATVGAAALVHALAVGARRRRRDLAVLRAIGFTSTQVTRALVVAALTTVGLGLAIGVPLGVGVGRVVWSDVLVQVGAAAPAVVPVGTLLIVVATALGVAIGAALVIGMRARRLGPAEVLRSE